MGDWLKARKDQIVAIGSIIQAVVLLAGFGFAMNEFVLNDAQLRRQRVNNTIEISKFSNPLVEANKLKEMLNSRHNLIDQIYSETLTQQVRAERIKFDEEVLDLRSIYEPYFQRINILAKHDIIDLNIACSLLFDNADRYIEFIWTYQPYESLHNEDVGYDLLSTFNFCQTCVEKYYYMGEDKSLAKDNYSNPPRGTAFGRL